CVGDDSPYCSYRASPWTTDGDAADVRTRSAQQLRTDRRHGRLDAKPRAYDLRLFERRCVVKGRRRRWRKKPFAGIRRQAGHGAARRKAMKIRPICTMLVAMVSSASFVLEQSVPRR